MIGTTEPTKGILSGVHKLNITEYHKSDIWNAEILSAA